MSWLVGQTARVVLTLALVGMGGTAFAQTQTIAIGTLGSSGGSAPALDGWTVTFSSGGSGCSIKIDTTSGACSSVDMVETIYHNRLYLTFENSTPSAALATAINGSATDDYADLVLTFQVQAPASVYSANFGLTGSATLAGGGSDTTDLVQVAGTENITNSSSTTLASFNQNLSSIPNPAKEAFSSASSDLFVSKDIVLNGPNATNAGASLALNTVMQMYAPAAPEPVSLSLFAVGVAGLAVVRRRRSR